MADQKPRLMRGFFFYLAFSCSFSRIATYLGCLSCFFVCFFWQFKKLYFTSGIPNH